MNDKPRFLHLLFLLIIFAALPAGQAVSQGTNTIFMPLIVGDGIGGSTPPPGPVSPTSAWGTVPSPNGNIDPGNQLNAVSVLSPNDIWAVGSWDFTINVKAQVQHWNGSIWSSVPIPPEAVDSELFGVAAVSADDVWLVGGYNNGGALILHWDGTALSVVNHPNPGLYTRFFAVTALSANDIWAVGEYANGGIGQTLTQHWDGTSWQVVPSPTDPGSYTELLGVTALATDDVWAVGSAGNASFAIHWDGNDWEHVNTPSPGTSVELTAVSAASTNNVWAVGDGSEGTLTLHWNGTLWTVVPSPTPSGFFQSLNAVVALSADEAWAVGFYSQGPKWYTLILQWDGIAWNVVPSPSPDPSINFLNGIDGDGSGGLWSVGRGGGTLVTQWDGSAWNVVPSANQGSAANELNGIAAITGDNIWAVGTAGDEALTLHWNGANWSHVPAPAFQYNVELNDVAALAANDVWAVGTTGSVSGLDYDTVILHWDGAQWTTIPSPNGNPDSYNELHAVAAVSADDVWAVGEYWGEFSYARPLILHWDGSTWSVVQQNCAAYNTLFALTVIAANDIWATGDALTCHYDGSSWTEVPSPQPRPDYNEISYALKDIDAVSSTDIWIVGTRTIEFGETLVTSPLAEHWDGTLWTAVYNFPILGSGVVALSTNNVWAVGSDIAHWDGHAWMPVPTPNPGEGSDLNDIAAVAHTELWAAGYFLDDDFKPQTLIENAPSQTQGAVRGDTNNSDTVITWFGPVSGSTGANPFGEYSAAGLPAGIYNFIASAPFCTPDNATVTVIAGTTLFQDFELDC